jgi:HNH endonuclease
MWEIKKIIRKGDYNYCVVDNHPSAISYGYVLHHRVIMENHLGRLLRKDEIVHHINENKLDNRIENLQLLTSSEHATLHGKQKGKKYAKLCCPMCAKVFSIEYRNCFKVKKGLFSACSRKCSGKFSSLIQKEGLTASNQSKLANNLIECYTKYADVS